MTSKMYRRIKSCTNLGCVIGALYFTISCVYQYILNKDSSSVTYKEFHEDEDSVYPSVSLCLWKGLHWLKNDKFSKCYMSFLVGSHEKFGGETKCPWNTTYAELDYHSMTKNLTQHVIGEKQSLMMSLNASILTKEP